jgi:chemotaxis protein histidine kinase CheA
MSDDALQELLLATFADQAKEQLQTINACLLTLEAAEGDERGPLLEEIFREAHSLKGASRAVDLGRVEKVAHELESLFSVIQKGELEADAEVFDLAYKTLDALTALVEDGLESAATVDPGATTGTADCRLPTADPEPAKPAHTLPVSTIFHTFPRMVRDMTRELSKEVKLTIEGGETEVDRRVLEQLRSPLTHMVRNSVDHGMEMPHAREAAGKQREGKLVLRAFKRAADLVIEIVDDGGGIDVEKVKARAVEKGLITAETAEGITERAALWLIFRPGLSTKQEITHLSGRGVGMDVVREHVERLHGRIDVESTPAEGSKFTLSVPLSAA